MSFFRNINRIAAAEPIITISAVTQATISNRVKLDSQIIEVEFDESSDQIAFITRANTQDYSLRNKKGLVLIFDKNIKSGKYSVTGSNSPFTTVYFFETRAKPGNTNYIEYEAQSGSFTVEAIENTTEKLHYEISFDFTGKNEGGEELKVVGTATYIVLIRSE